MNIIVITMSSAQYSTRAYYVYACSFCPSMYETKIGLMSHTYEHHNEAISGPKKPTVINVAPNVDISKIEKFQDQVKGLGLTPLPLCVRKKLVNFKSQSRNYSKDKSGIECLICLEKFENYHSLKSHIDNFHLSPRIKCIYCNYETYSNTLLRNHIKKHNLSSFNCEKCTKQFMHLSDFINHNKQIHNSNYLYKDEFKCPLCDFKGAYRPHVRQHIIDKHCKEVTVEEEENDVDDPGTKKDLQGLGELSEREDGKFSHYIDDPRVGVQTEITEFRIQEENKDKEESNSDIVSHQDNSDPLQRVSIDPGAIQRLSMQPEFPCSLCSFKSHSELECKSHILAKHMLRNLRQVVNTPTISPPPVKKDYPQDLKSSDIFVCSYCDFKDSLNSQVMQHIHAKHPGHPVLLSIQPTTPDLHVKRPMEVSCPQKQVSDPALKVKIEFSDV